MAILQFSDTTLKKGIVQQIQKRTKSSVSGNNAYSVAEIAVDVNMALAEYWFLANKYSGRWKPADDTNQIDYPIGYMNINSGTQDLVFLTDATGNQVLDIYKIRLKSTANGAWTTLEELDMDDYNDDFLNNTTTGIPTGYWITANGIIFNCVPNFTLANACEIFFRRTSTYFASTDTTKTAGIPDEHQKFLVIKPSYEYCAINGLEQTPILREILYGADGKSGLYGDIKQYYTLRNRVERKRMIPMAQNNK